MTLSPHWLDELRSRLSLSAVIGRTTRLTKAGREFKACCPFHDEKSPSFTVNDEKGFYHCFGCSAHGDVIRWMTDQRGLGFMDAVKELAAEAGMELPAPDPRAAQEEERRLGLREALAAAQDWFVASLNGAGGAAARRYLAGRGFPLGTVERFGFGYAPADRQALREALHAFPHEVLVEAGLRIVAEGREPYDRFRDRLTLPIRDPRGRVIGFGGRILDAAATDAPKYLNSPDTPLFDKGRSLYNLDRAGPLARKSGRLVVVEGYMDVVALAAAGIEEAVAPLGTALTEAQIELLWRVCETPVLCFDGDAAGQRAAHRAVLRALPLLRAGHSLAIATLPAGFDPDDLVKAKGAAAMHQVIAAARPLVETLWQFEHEAQPIATPEAKAGLKARLLEQVDAIAHPDIRALYRRDLLARFSALAFPPRPAAAPAGPRGRFRPVQPVLSSQGGRLQKGAAASRDALLAAVLAGLVRHPAGLERHADSLARLTTPVRHHAELLDVLVEFADSGAALEPDALAPILARRGLASPPPEDHAGIRFAFLVDDSDRVLAAEELADAIAVLVERPAIRTAKDEAMARFAQDPEGATADLARLRDRELAFERRLRQRAGARAGNDNELNGQHGGQRQD
ncbi:MAG: DNA primase [Novosphingobium sp.]